MTEPPSDVVDRLKTVREELLTDGPPPGRAWCDAWTAAVDDALVALAAPATARHARLAVVAVGGYGRSELCPGSDVDLLLVHDRLDEADLEPIVREVVYPLWDVGLSVGYAVRDRREAVAAIDDLDTATAVLDLRPVAGDRGLAHQVRTEAIHRLKRRPQRFLQALARADSQRRAKAGDAAEVLEPNLKDGAGGLRDVQSLRWAAAALVGTTGIDPLVPAGYLAAPDRARLHRAYEALLAARVGLHLVAADRQEPGKHEQLRLDLQDAVAAHAGYVDRAEHDLAPHQLLGELYLAARTVDHVHRRAWALIDADVSRGKRRLRRPTESEVDGFELVDGVLRLPETSADRPGAAGDLTAEDLPVRLFAALADTGAVLDRRSAARLRSAVDAGWENEAGHPWRWTDAARARFCDVLWRGEVALPALAELDDVGLVTALIPEWAALRGRPQRNPFHRFALDRHAWHAAAALGDLVRREHWAVRALGQVADREALLLGTLLHDVGKAHGEPHSETGVPVAQAIVRRLGGSEATAEVVGRMVRLHLVLPDAARKRDVTDPALAGEIAELVGDRSMLATLHLLAAADGRATGPGAWTDWTAQLVDTLVTKVGAVLDEQPPEEVTDGSDVTARDAIALGPDLGAEPGVVEQHLHLLPDRYAAAVTPRAAVRHALMAATRPGPTEVRTRVTPGERRVGDPDPVPGTRAADAGGEVARQEPDELDVVALDHPGWFAKVAGVLALHGGSIVAADAFTRRDGLAVDTFRVRPPEGVGGSWWAGVEGDLAEAAAGRLAVRARVARKARAEQRRIARLPDVPTTVTTEPDASGRSTIIEVHTLDRIGVLYAIATAFAELELDIVVARVQTLGHEVVDAFYLRDAEGNPLDRDHLTELELGVRSALDEL
ncbi:HD domain-containing protein [Nitriliruptor alkaliphilus]|uniref:[protein-PII] uridylyltransferase family protein n=1 Tax=Nitriliruptor alkaliphilus TaxID=427918 RepID=UPI000698D286|nr:HD domain-containing protein [Nitriliruptor alkaliphilus]